ncbi:MAG: hypothetical protein WC661_09185 [Opitutaceae bacterium]|jgi:hypothetical protein
MPRLTDRTARVTTRNPRSHAVLLAAALGCVALGAGGCSTPGPNHTYVAATGDEPILDLSDGAPIARIPSYLFSVNELYGIAYDPFTDHLFLRVAPGNFIRVIDRPARAIKYDFTAEGLPAKGGGDLAIRSRDRHLFFVHPTEPVLVETTLRGKHIRDIKLESLYQSPSGVAYDQKLDRLFILTGGDLSKVTAYSLDGKRLGAVGLDRNVLLTSLAFDSVAREFYVPLQDESAIGVFNLKGNLVRAIPLRWGQNRDHVDVGPRSLIRLF